MWETFSGIQSHMALRSEADSDLTIPDYSGKVCMSVSGEY